MNRRTPAAIVAWALWPAVALVAGCASLGLPTPGLPDLGLPKLSALKLPKPPAEDISQKRRNRSEAAALRFEKNRDFAEYQAALFCQQQGNDQASIRGLVKLLKRNPDHREARLLLADLLMEQNSPAEAAENVQYLLDKNPSDAGAHHALAVLLDASGDEAGAMAHYERSAALEPESEIYRVSYQTALAASKPLEGEFDVAHLPSVPPSPAVPTPERPIAQRSITRQLAAVPDPGQNTLASQPNPIRRLPAVPRAPAAAPVPPQLAGQPDRVDRAETTDFDDDVEKAGRVEPASGAGPVTDAGLAATDSFGTGRWEAGNAHSAAELMKMGKREISAGNTATAAAYFRKAMAANPDDPQIPATAATAALRHNQPAAAIELLQEAVRAFPSSASLYQILAAAYYRRGDYGSSQVAAQQALSLDNSNALAYFLVGSALARLGRAEAAEVHLRQARRLDPRYGATR